MVLSSLPRNHQGCVTAASGREKKDDAGPLSITELTDERVEKNVDKENCNVIDAMEIVEDLSKQQQRRFEGVSILPTIEEITASEEERGEATTGSHNNEVHYSVDDLSHLLFPRDSTTTKWESSKQEVRKIISRASEHVARGQERKALELYREALDILKQGVKSVSTQMEIACSKPKLEKAARYIVLHEEWSELAMAVAKIRTLMSVLYERQGEYDTSICNCEEARKIYEQQAVYDERHQRNTFRAGDKEIETEETLRRLEVARESYAARTAFHETIGRIQEKIQATKDQTSLDFLYEDLHEQISVVLSLERIHLGEQHPQVADTKAMLSSLYTELGQPDKALAILQEALRISEQTLGVIHPATALKYKQLAKLYEKMGGSNNVILAIQFYAKAITSFKQSEGNASRHLCSLFNDIGMLYIQQHNYGLALRNFNRALDLCIKGRTDSKETSSVYLVQIRLNLAKCYSMQQETDRAVNATLHALNIQKELQKMHVTANGTHFGSHSLFSAVGLADTQQRLAEELTAQKKYEEAYAVLEEGLTLVKAEYSKAQDFAIKNPTIDLGVYQDTIASILFALAEAHQADSKYSESIKMYRESLQRRKAADKVRPAGSKLNNIYYLRCMAGIGSVYLEKNQPSEAFKIFSAAIHLAKKETLPDSHPILKSLWDKSHVASRKMLVDSAIDTKAEF
jgi:tetratricopeptide (TPR) repeat protein